ncbi:hypothetical protein [Microseira wollei]|uniref:Uncharacterized protein n=1 Tax=Microseira wollei NIES-4236 TaxID=2530354 RepID=A0AAV3XFW6_9CYAN|nr:hypothetical protein [Microseira wollei]GET40393.1 hypothetical protein MiSe_52020 [Microseira wollei NIES-4236]
MAGRTEKYSHQQLASWRLASAVQPTIVITSNLGYLFTDDAPEFYKKIGFTEQPVGMAQVIGKWLVNE